MQDKTPKNDKRQPHGFWEKYHDNGKLWFKGEYLNGLEEGPFEVYYDNGQLFYKGNYKKGERIGCLEWYNPDGSINQTNFYAK